MGSSIFTLGFSLNATTNLPSLFGHAVRAPNGICSLGGMHNAPDYRGWPILNGHSPRCNVALLISHERHRLESFRRIFFFLSYKEKKL